MSLGDRDYPILSYREKRALLEDLSLWMMRNSHSTVEIGATDERFNGKLTNMPEIAPEVTGTAVRSFLVDRSGMIREPVAGEIDFTHRTFEEFLAAQAAIDEQDIGFLVDKSIDDQWRETVILASGALWVFTTRGRWQDMPARFGNFDTAKGRVTKLRSMDLWEPFIAKAKELGYALTRGRLLAVATDDVVVKFGCPITSLFGANQFTPVPATPQRTPVLKCHLIRTKKWV